MAKWMSEVGRARAAREFAAKMRDDMGPIERELRGIDLPHYDWCNPTWPVLDDAARSLGLEWRWLETSKFDADVLSEAIEAAEALGL